MNSLPEKPAERETSLYQRGLANDLSSLRSLPFFGRWLLLVDDNDFNAMLAFRLMQALGFEVITAANGAIALQIFERRQFDVVLMDCQMPVMDGYDATRAIRERERRISVGRTPVIAVTGYAFAGNREKCLAAGMDDFLAKPYALSDLQPKLLRWVRPAAQEISALSGSGSGTDLPSRFTQTVFAPPVE